MALNSQQISQLLNEARAAGLDDDELEALAWSLYDRAAQLDGATRLDMALSLADAPEVEAADTFMVEFASQRKAAIKRGAAAINAISVDEWERLTNE